MCVSGWNLLGDSDRPVCRQLGCVVPGPFGDHWLLLHIWWIYNKKLFVCLFSFKGDRETFNEILPSRGEPSYQRHWNDAGREELHLLAVVESLLVLHQSLHHLGRHRRQRPEAEQVAAAATDWTWNCLLQVILVWSLMTLTPPSYAGIKPPGWGMALGWCMALFILSWIPLVAFYKLIRAEGSLWKVCSADTRNVLQTSLCLSSFFFFAAPEDSLLPVRRVASLSWRSPKGAVLQWAWRPRDRL